MSNRGIVLEVENLHYAYADRQAVCGASFRIHSGEIFGFLGPNGAGKTTTIGCVSGLRAHWQGEIRFRQRPFRPARRSEDRGKLGVVPQELALYEGLTGRENLQFFGRLSGLKASRLREAVDRALELAGLAERADEPVTRYSGGMKRRLNFAVGDLHQPELLLLDEPTAGVDPQSRGHLFEALRSLRQSGRSLLYTTHYMEEAQRLCDRVAIMNEGSVVAVGTPDELAADAGIPGADLEAVFLQLTGRSLRDG
ncbi:MAG: ABC transporter ATP-binding protein [Pirellulales bacterium]|nr:ABC transporter ATP-binding protein [Pirellulales bacterium]